VSAILSPCGKYRFRLERDVDLLAGGPVFAYFGVNPSTAGAHVNDSTVRKWIGFTKVFGGSRFIVGNVFAYRATDVRELLNDPAPAFSLEQQQHLRAIAADADVLVPCWGNRSKVPADRRHHFENVLHLLRQTGKPIKVFGFTMSGDPLHPLMLGYDTPLLDWPSTNSKTLSQPAGGTCER
jgi:hypothetical protein